MCHLIKLYRWSFVTAHGTGCKWKLWISLLRMIVTQSLDPWTSSMVNEIAGTSHCKLSYLTYLMSLNSSRPYWVWSRLQKRARGTLVELENKTVMIVGDSRRRRRREQDARFSFLRDAVVLRDLDCCVLWIFRPGMFTSSAILLFSGYYINHFSTRVRKLSEPPSVCEMFF